MFSFYSYAVHEPKISVLYNIRQAVGVLECLNCHLEGMCTIKGVIRIRERKGTSNYPSLFPSFPPLFFSLSISIQVLIDSLIVLFGFNGWFNIVII